MGSVKVSHSVEGVVDADVIYNDVWVSAGMEEEKKKRMKVFPKFQVNATLVKKAKDDCIVMHCLPAKREVEITSEVMDSPQSVVIDQAENRMHAQKGLMVWILDQ
jgi:ornithine carbamoyltransferase